METTLPLVVASVLMVLAAIRKRRVGWINGACPVCHRPKDGCTCRWL
jgi:hypothetical protein